MMILYTIIAALIACMGGAVPFVRSYLPTDDIPRFRLARQVSTLSNITSALGPRLSPNASIILPSNSSTFDNATTYWQTFAKPQIAVVVSVASEADVVATVQYANGAGVPFLTIGGAHGATNALGNAHGAIQIWTRRMRAIAISADGKTARVQAGARTVDVKQVLFEAGKQAVTGSCECTGMAGPTLGGGHGWLQGWYGVVSDNLVSARVVLGNGSVVDTSAEKNPDLFWALRGAGHNFGIVVEFEIKVYDIDDTGRDWYYEVMSFSGDQVEVVFDQINAVQLAADANPPVQLQTFAAFARNADLDGTDPVVQLTLLYQGSFADADEYAAPFRALGSLSWSNGTTDIVGLPQVTGNALNQSFCQHGVAAELRFPVGLVEYNVTAQRAAYDSFANWTATRPEFNASLFLFEGYAVQGMQALDESQSAFPNRADKLLVSPFIIYEQNGSTELDAAALEAGRQMRSILLDGRIGGSELHAYVNYAHGDESAREIYGFDERKIEKLRALKREYDPEGKFDFYCPITMQD